jgi:hypothetical protein
VNIENVRAPEAFMIVDKQQESDLLYLQNETGMDSERMATVWIIIIILAGVALILVIMLIVIMYALA